MTVIPFPERRRRARRRTGRAATSRGPRRPLRLVPSFRLPVWLRRLPSTVALLVGLGVLAVALLDPPAGPGGAAVAHAPAGNFPLCGNGGGGRGNCVIDGDTFTYRGSRIRIADINAPETHEPSCAREGRLGAQATRRLQTLLNAGPFELVRTGRDTDRYGRSLRVVRRDGRSLGAVLVAEGLAETWTGRRHPEVFCRG